MFIYKSNIFFIATSWTFSIHVVIFIYDLRMQNLFYISFYVFVKLLIKKFNSKHKERKFKSQQWNQKMQTISKYKTKIMYFYYISMQIYVLIINVHSPFYFLCITIMSHNSPSMDFTFTNYVKTLENQASISFTNLFHKTLHSYNKLFSLSEGVSKNLNTHLYTT
jgi:L-lactate permease